jgi:hypothetical protein
LTSSSLMGTSSVWGHQGKDLAVLLLDQWIVFWTIH